MDYNTRNPLGSSDPRDLFDNSSDFDEGMNSTADTFLDRFGRPRYTWNLYEKMTQNALDQVQETVDSAKDQVDAARDDGIQRIGQSVSAVDAVEESAIASMEETAANLGDDLNTKSFKMYSEMQSSPQTRDGVVGIVDGDPDPNLNGWYQWSNSLQRWSRIDNQPLIADTGFNQDTMFALLDSARRETWLGVNSRDGGPTVHAERLLRLLFGMFLNQRTGYIAALTDANGLMTDLAIRDTDGQFDDFVMDRMTPRINQRIPDKLETAGRTGYLFALRDSAGYMTDLCVDDATGQFPPFVVERLARRIVPYLPQAADSAWFLNDKYTDSNGDVQRVFTNMLSWSGWGSSTIDEWAELGTIARSFGATYYNGGNGGTELQHNMAQMGVRPALLMPSGGAIPDSGQVVVACSNVSKNKAFRATAGTLQGVAGTLTCTDSDWIFTRAQSGTAVTVDSEQPFIPTQGLAHRGDLWLFNEGKNDINNGTPMAQLLAWHRLAFNWNSAFSKRVIVLTHFGNSGRAGTDHIRKIEQLNAFIKSTYTDNVFDLQAYLCSSEIWADVGITPTASDLQNQAAGCLAASLSRDNDAHMNPATRAAVAEKIKQKLLSMGWFKA
ncbi:hypothetical protein [Pseudomonas fulva]|uniref:hypothetical protein n=1 Tax=Pseudomonas fulva TaxID=47880 RepID=UPI003D2F38B3